MSIHATHCQPPLRSREPPPKSDHMAFRLAGISVQHRLRLSVLKTCFIHFILCFSPTWAVNLVPVPSITLRWEILAIVCIAMLSALSAGPKPEQWQEAMLDSPGPGDLTPRVQRLREIRL